MTDKLWLCRLAFMLLNYIVYFCTDGDHIVYWRSRESDVREEFEKFAREP